ncbi:MAG: amidase [Acidobacteriia bacterium]|nr:amidase [Terriglobia bacterium]
MKEIVYASATNLAQAIRAKKVSSSEVVSANLEFIGKVNPKLNAIVQLAPDAATAQAKKADEAMARGENWGSLHGVPITIKDGWETKGIISSAGTAGRALFVPQEDATVVARLRSAGAIVLGKTNVPELSLTNETDNAVYGRTNNPYDLSRTPGGSGGGQAAIIAAGGSPLDIGCDAGGSIRNPSHFCGIAGIKPTTGLVPLTGYFPFPTGVRAQLTAAGPMARTVEDLVLTLPLVIGIDWRDPLIVPRSFDNPAGVDLQKISAAFYVDNGIIPPTPETAEVVRKAANVLHSAGVRFQEACPPGIQQTSELFSSLMGADGGAEVNDMLQLAGTKEMCSWLKRRREALVGREVSGAGFSRLLSKLDAFRRTMLSFLEKFHAIICPVHASPALIHHTTYDGDNIYRFSYAQTYNLTGWPCVVVRGGTSPDGLPIGVQIVARPWCECVALELAAHLESALGGWQPPSL